MADIMAFLLEKEHRRQNPVAEIKPPMPAKFLGVRDPTVVENWIGDVDQYFEFTNLPEEKRLGFALLLLDDKAKVWWRRYSDMDAPTGWEGLKQAIKDYFIPSGAQDLARGKLANLKQTRSVQHYIEEFQELRMICGDVSEPEAKDRFKRGLHLEIQEHVAIHRPDTVARAMELALNYEDARSSVRTPKQAWKQTSYRGPEPMELDVAAVQSGQGSSKRPKGKKKANQTKGPRQCWACGEEDHLVMECPLVEMVKDLKAKAPSA